MNGLTAPKTKILGMEFAGTVESIGRSVTRFSPGDQVFGITGFKFGCHAEYICMPETGGVAIKPNNMTPEEAAAVMFGAISALHFLRKGKIQAGQRVLIYGASGSVGVFAVQLAKHYGAHVAAVCSTANLELVKSLGADEVIDYTKDDFSKSGRIYNIVVDAVGKSGFWRGLKSLKRGGFYLQVAYKPSFWFGSKWAAITGAATVLGGMVKAAPGDQAFLKELIESGKLRTVIDRCYPLHQIADAHRHAESGHKKGHVVVAMERPNS